MRKILILILLLSSCQNMPNEEKSIANGSVSSAHPLATSAGLEILNKGGNAFDAAIAVASTLNVVEPMMSGIGGYGTILVYDAKTQKVRFLNPSGRFPSKTNTDMMRAPASDFMKNRSGPKSISTPGNLNAWASMHSQYGNLPWSILFETAIKVADHGFEVTPFLSWMISIGYDDFSEYSRSFYGKNGHYLKEGDTLIQKDLAKTFRLIAKEGVESFYHGELAEIIDKKMQEVESFLSISDLKTNEAEWWDPLVLDYRGYKIYTAALPANSFAAFVNLGLMKQFPKGSFQHNSSEYLHLFAEMTKESYKARLAYSFDPEIQEAPLDSLFSSETLQKWVSTLDSEKATTFKPPYDPESRNTTHFVVADQWGNVVSATQTLGNVFGSRIMVDGTGIWLNNSMAYSTFEPKGNPMDAFPGRHKLSGDCPIIILKDELPWAALGSPGGHTITQNVPQIIINLIDFEMSIQKAIDAPKIAFVEPNNLRVDKHMPQEVIESLISKGHRTVKQNIGNAHGIRIFRDQKGNITGFEEGVDFRSKQAAPIMDR